MRIASFGNHRIDTERDTLVDALARKNDTEQLSEKSICKLVEIANRDSGVDKKDAAGVFRAGQRPGQVASTPDQARSLLDSISKALANITNPAVKADRGVMLWRAQKLLDSANQAARAAKVSKDIRVLMSASPQGKSARMQSATEKRIALDHVLAELADDKLNELDFSKMDLTGVDLRSVSSRLFCERDGNRVVPRNLSGLNLTGANLADMHLVMYNFSEVTLCRANLRGANLTLADLRGADLRGADLSHANLTRVITRQANPDAKPPASALGADGSTAKSIRGILKNKTHHALARPSVTPATDGAEPDIRSSRRVRIALPVHGNAGRS